VAKREEKAAAAQARAETFEAIRRSWLSKTVTRRGPNTQSRLVSWLEKNIFTVIGPTRITELRPRDILGAVRKIENRSAVGSARRVLGYIGQIFEYAIAIKAVSADITGGLHRAPRLPHQPRPEPCFARSTPTADIRTSPRR
jgi:hypothetical protein